MAFFYNFHNAKDNHSLMQLYLDGPKNNFFTFFSTKEKFTSKINSKRISNEIDFLKKNLNDVLSSQISATQKVFKKESSF